MAQQGGTNISALKKAAKELYEGLQQLDTVCPDDEQKVRVGHAKAQCRELFLQMKNFVSTILFDLESTREQLNQSSDQMLGRVSEQLDKVTESTEDAVQSVLNRLDTICDRQNEVFQGLAELKSRLENKDHSSKDCKVMTETANRLEELENEIQTETFEIMNAMQFQDITSQQMQQANALISEAKGKLTELNVMLNLFRTEEGSKQQDKDGKQGPVTFDPAATMKDRETRQQLADDIENGYKES